MIPGPFARKGKYQGGGKEATREGEVCFLSRWGGGGPSTRCVAVWTGADP